MKTYFAVLLVLLFATQGCLMVPFPNRSTDAFGVVSQVVDAESGAPVPHARIYAHDPHAFVEADEAGRFQIEPLLQWHAGYLFGVISYPIWPATTDVVPRRRTFKVVAPGYQDEVFAADADPQTSKQTSLPAEVKGTKLHIPHVRILRQQEAMKGQ